MHAVIHEITPPAVIKLAKKIIQKPAEPVKKAPIQGREQEASFYDKTFADNDHWKRHYTQSHYYPLWTILVDRITRQGAESVFDIGCGPGQFATFLRDKGLKNYTGIDFSSLRIAHAKDWCPEYDFVEGDVYKTDLFTSKDYDAIICMEFLEHVNEDLAAIERIQSGTKFYGTVPNFPFEAHVRHFQDAEEVEARYKHLFSELTVDTHLENTTKKFFIMEGIVA